VAVVVLTVVLLQVMVDLVVAVEETKVVITVMQLSLHKAVTAEYMVSVLGEEQALGVHVNLEAVAVALVVKDMMVHTIVIIFKAAQLNQTAVQENSGVLILHIMAEEEAELSRLPVQA
jgi:prolyl-tRNA editing enzyme YbaK/EbsC (Cys-tRNA(Pro) deacylase)